MDFLIIIGCLVLLYFASCLLNRFLNFLIFKVTKDYTDIMPEIWWWSLIGTIIILFVLIGNVLSYISKKVKTSKFVQSDYTKRWLNGDNWR